MVSLDAASAAAFGCGASSGHRQYVTICVLKACPVSSLWIEVLGFYLLPSAGDCTLPCICSECVFSVNYTALYAWLHSKPCYLITKRLLFMVYTANCSKQKTFLLQATEQLALWKFQATDTVKFSVKWPWCFLMGLVGGEFSPSDLVITIQ